MKKHIGRGQCCRKRYNLSTPTVQRPMRRKAIDCVMFERPNFTGRDRFSISACSLSASERVYGGPTTVGWPVDVCLFNRWRLVTGEKYEQPCVAPTLFCDGIVGASPTTVLFFVYKILKPSGQVYYFGIHLPCWSGAPSFVDTTDRNCRVQFAACSVVRSLSMLRTTYCESRSNLPPRQG